MDFKQVVEALNDGKMAKRSGWNDKSLFIFKQVPSVISRDIVPKMQSLPQSVKNEFEKRFNDPSEQINAIYYDNQIAIVNRSNLISGWTPSVIDVFSQDWIVLDQFV